MANARGFMDDAPLEFDCPECGRSVTTTVGAGRRNHPIDCPGGHTINVEGSGLDRAAREAEAAVEKLMRSFD